MGKLFSKGKHIVKVKNIGKGKHRVKIGNHFIHKTSRKVKKLKKNFF